MRLGIFMLDLSIVAQKEREKTIYRKHSERHPVPIKKGYISEHDKKKFVRCCSCIVPVEIFSKCEHGTGLLHKMPYRNVIYCQ